MVRWLLLLLSFPHRAFRADAACNIIEKSFGTGADAFSAADWTLGGKIDQCSVSPEAILCSLKEEGSGSSAAALYAPAALQPSADDPLVVVVFSLSVACGIFWTFGLNLIHPEAEKPAWALSINDPPDKALSYNLGMQMLKEDNSPAKLADFGVIYPPEIKVAQAVSDSVARIDDAVDRPVCDAETTWQLSLSDSAITVSREIDDAFVIYATYKSRSAWFPGREEAGLQVQVSSGVTSGNTGTYDFKWSSVSMSGCEGTCHSKGWLRLIAFKGGSIARERKVLLQKSLEPRQSLIPLGEISPAKSLEPAGAIDSGVAPFLAIQHSTILPPAILRQLLHHPLALPGLRRRNSLYL